MRSNSKFLFLLLLISGGLLFITLIFLILINFSSTSKNRKPLPTPTPVNISSRDIPPPITTLPTIPNTKAIDTSSEIVKSSQTEIKKLYPFLPYLYDFTSSNGIKISIVIPGKDLQDDPWKLTVQVFGVDFQIPKSDPSYQLHKNAFREAAFHVFAWMKAHNVDSGKVIIKWGDKAFIQERATEWLKDN